METLNDNNFDESISQGVAVVDFYADWCGPCKMMGPIFEETAGEVKGVKFFKLNVDEAKGTASKFGVMSIPTLIVFKNGEEVERLMGVQQKDQFIKTIKNHL